MLAGVLADTGALCPVFVARLAAVVTAAGRGDAASAAVLEGIDVGAVAKVMRALGNANVQAQHLPEDAPERVDVAVVRAWFEPRLAALLAQGQSMPLIAYDNAALTYIGGYVRPSVLLPRLGPAASVDPTLTRAEMHTIQRRPRANPSGQRHCRAYVCMCMCARGAPAAAMCR